MRKRIFLVLGLGLTLLYVSCQNILGDSTSNLDYAALSGFVGEALNGTIVQRSVCVNSDFDSCTSSRRVRNFSTGGADTNPCSRGTYDVFGQAILTFESATCSMNVGESQVRTLANHYLVDRFGQKLLSYTDVGVVAGITLGAADLQDFEGTTRSGGSELAVTGTNTKRLNITGLHRRVYTSGGNLQLWHTVYTPAPLSVDVVGASSTISSGTIVVKNNQSQATVTQTLTALVFNQTCCYPESGSIRTRVTSRAASESFTIRFSQFCGVAEVDGYNEVLPTCGS